MYMLYTYKVKLYPTRMQEILLNKHLGARRWVYNNLLSFRKQEYLENEKGLSYTEMCAWIKKQKDTEYGWLKEINSQTLQQAAKDLDGAYSNFFKGNAKFPRYTSKYGNQGFRVPASSKLESNRLSLPKFKAGIKYKSDREITGKIRTCTIIKDTIGDYYATLVIDREIQPLPKTKKAAGVDVGIKTLAICSDGQTVSNPKYTKQYEHKIKILSRRLAKKKRGSQNRLKAKHKLAKAHQKISNSRKDHLHKATYKIVKDNDIIVIEDLNTKGMLRNRKLSKAVADSSFGEIKRQLEYKAGWYGKQLIKVSRWFPSSKTCSRCNWIKQNLKLSDRVFKCSQCAFEVDRDWNASVNILRQGLNDYMRCGTPSKPVEFPLVDDRVLALLRSNGTMKQETLGSKEPHAL